MKILATNVNILGRQLLYNYELSGHQIQLMYSNLFIYDEDGNQFVYFGRQLQYALCHNILILAEIDNHQYGNVNSNYLKLYFIGWRRLLHKSIANIPISQINVIFLVYKIIMVIIFDVSLQQRLYTSNWKLANLNKLNIKTSGNTFIHPTDIWLVLYPFFRFVSVYLTGRQCHQIQSSFRL